MKRIGAATFGNEPLAPKLLPNALTTFEAVARHESIALAAAELNVAASAISRHIANLEQRLSLRLFVRKGNRLILTRDGADLAEAVREGLGLIQTRIADIQIRSSGTLMLGCSPDIALSWVMPRYDRIVSAVDATYFRMLISNDYREFDQPSVDLSIRLGETREWPDHETIPFLKRTCFPVCAPSLLDRFPDIANGSSEAILKAPLLHYCVPTHDVGGWREWLGVDGPIPGPIFSSFNTMVHATTGGHGISLATAGFIEPYLQSGQLVPLGEARDMPGAYHIVLRQPEHPAARRLARLLTE